MATSDRQQADVATCPECRTRARPDGDELYCPACGYVLETNRVDHGREWRDQYDPNAEHNGKRTKASDRVLQDRGLGSEISTDGGTEDPDWQRKRKRNQWARADRKDRGRGYATTEIHRITSALELPGDWGEHAKRLFTSIHEDVDLGGHYSLDAFAAAAVYAVCRVQQRGLTPADVAAKARCGPDRLRRTYGYLQRETSLQAPPPDAEQRLRVVAREAEVPDAAREDALDLLDRVSDHERSRGSPSTLAAALLWVAGEDVTQAGVAEAADVTATAVRMRWRRASEDLPGVEA